jgi:hypothetical protein
MDVRHDEVSDALQRHATRQHLAKQRLCRAGRTDLHQRSVRPIVQQVRRNRQRVAQKLQVDQLHRRVRHRRSNSEHRLNFLPKLGTLRAGCGTRMFPL